MAASAQPLGSHSQARVFAVSDWPAEPHNTLKRCSNAARCQHARPDWLLALLAKRPIFSRSSSPPMPPSAAASLRRSAATTGVSAASCCSTPACCSCCRMLMARLPAAALSFMMADSAAVASSTSSAARAAFMPGDFGLCCAAVLSALPMCTAGKPVVQWERKPCLKLEGSSMDAWKKEPIRGSASCCHLADSTFQQY